jgi:hypothetical protein
MEPEANHVQERMLIGTLLPSIDDLPPVIRQLRQKDGLPEVRLDDEPSSETFLDGKPVREDFRQETRAQVHTIPDLAPHDQARALASAQRRLSTPVAAPWLDLIPEADRSGIEQFCEFAPKQAEFVNKRLMKFPSGAADMLYIHRLTGETQELTRD